MGKKYDWITCVIPMFVISICGLVFGNAPQESNAILSKIRMLFGDTWGTFYIVLGLVFFLISLMLCGPKYGNIVLGNANEKPKYSFGTWGCMMFTCGLAADILFYSFSEWILYATNLHISELGSLQEWANVYPLFHWSFIPWSFYLVLAVAFGFMLHVRKKTRQKFSEACRPILGKYTDGILGRIIDLLAVFALLAGTATTFSVATPLMSAIIQSLFDISVSRTTLTIIIICITCLVYSCSLLHGFKGMGILSKGCIALFVGLMFFVLLFGGNGRYIIETGIESLGRMIQNFMGLSTYIDPTRKTNFAQDWTIYYWAYWIVWCVATPFFIGNISRGRTIKQTIIGGYIFGAGTTISSFIIFGNYSLGLQVMGKYDFITRYSETEDIYSIILSVIQTIPGSSFILIGVLITMIAFYATSFDSIAYTAACYSYKKIDINHHPNKSILLMWCVLLIVLPISLVFSESSMNNIQTVSIIAAFPLGIVMILILFSFFKDVNRFLEEQK